MARQLALIMFVIALQIGFAEGGFFSAVTDFFDNVGQTIEKAWNDIKEPVLDAGAAILAPLSSAVSVTSLGGFLVLMAEKAVYKPHGSTTKFECGPNTNSFYKGLAEFQIEFAWGCTSKRDVVNQCCITHDACYGICGETQQNCDKVFCKKAQAYSNAAPRHDHFVFW
ncbi:hypothetical protein niasHS_008089 [Heterodera schachtii]|uniref:Uncharacterized protein n=1 Tax=Heterodera schachtii TaxID=97005 RepID=A0ABD2J7K3_HETSC